MVFEHWLRKFTHLFFGYPAVAIGDGFEASDFEALAFLDDFDEGGGFAEGVVSAGVKPGETAL